MILAATPPISRWDWSSCEIMFWKTLTRDWDSQEHTGGWFYRNETMSEGILPTLASGKRLLCGLTSSSLLRSHFACGSFPDGRRHVSEKPNRLALCNVCAPAILLTSRACCCWFGILFCLTTGKTDKEDSPVQLGRHSNKARGEKTHKLLNGGRPSCSWDSQVLHRQGNLSGASDVKPDPWGFRSCVQEMKKIRKKAHLTEGKKLHRTLT